MSDLPWSQTWRPGWLRRSAPMLGVVLFALGVSLTSDLAATRRHAFQSDEATYYAMAQSLAHDHDLVYERQDLARVYEEFPSGPQGIFLKRAEDGRLVYGKGYLLPLLAAPFVGVLGARGFLALHALLLAGCVAAGAGWLRSLGGSRGAVASAAAFVGASVLPVYTRWMTTEVLHFALVFLGTALWFRPPFRRAPLAAGWPARLGADKRDLAAALVYALATFLKPIPNALLTIPLGLGTLARGRIRGSFALGLVFVATLAGLFQINRWATGEYNYQGGDRWTCYFHFPLEDARTTIEDCFSMSTNELDDTAGISEWFVGWKSYLSGRFGGVLWHFPAGMVALLAFLRRPRDPWRWGLLAVAIAEIGWALYLIPFNYVGGGGAIGNRYFMGTYALLFYLLLRPLRPRELALTWVLAGLLLGTALLAPAVSTASPGVHAMGFPWRWFPPDRELLLDLPTNTNPHAFGKSFGDPTRYKLYFLDDSFYRQETGCDWVPDEVARGAGCFWTRGARTTEVLLQTAAPPEKVLMHAKNGARPNRVRIELGAESRELDLGPGEVRSVELPPQRGFHYRHKGLDVWVYRVSVASARGFVPGLDSEDGRSGDPRFLGVFVNIDVRTGPGPGSAAGQG